jgi:hypothetical protein
MTPDKLKQKSTERITEWVTGGSYAVAVEVEASIYPNRPDSPCLSREAILFLEKLARAAEAGEVETLKKAGTVYVLLEKIDPQVSSGKESILSGAPKNGPTEPVKKSVRVAG